MLKAPFSKRVITLHYSEDDITRSDCEFDTRNPGKFERESVYIPFMWNRILMWGELPDDLETDAAFNEYCDYWGLESDYINNPDPEFYQSFERYTYHPTMEDRLLFPELEHIESVVLWETEQGFVESDSRELPVSQDTIFVGI